MSTTLAPAAEMFTAFAATVETSVALGTNLWKVYEWSVDVVSTITPNPADKTVEPTPLIVIVALLATLPLLIVTSPFEGVRVELISLILIKVPAPLFTSGLVLGKLVSFAIGTKPPTSSTRSIIRKSIAAEVATLESLPDHVSPLAIVSLESCLRNAASAAADVKKDVSFFVADACSLDVITVAVSNLFEVIEPSA